MNTNDMEWTRASYDTTLMHCSGDDLPLQVWYGRVGSLMDGLKGMSEFQIHDNGYVRFPGVLVIEGVKGIYKGHRFSIWSDIPGQILLRHPDVPRSAVESLCGRIKECWLSLERTSRALACEGVWHAIGWCDTNYGESGSGKVPVAAEEGLKCN